MKVSQSTIVDGRRVVYDRMGEADNAVIFIHGGFGSSSELWHPSMQALPEDFAGYAINNFIRSEAPPEGYSVANFAKRLTGLPAALGLDRPVIVGHSMGGVVCQLASLIAPETFGGMVLVGTGPSMRNHGVGQQLLDRLRTEGFSEQLMREVSANWFYREPPEGFFDGYVARALTASPEAMIDVQASLLETDLVDRLSLISIPTLIVHGAHDVGRPLDHALLLQKGIPGSQLHVCEDSGHSPMLETQDEFNAVFHRFLNTVFNQSAPLSPSN